MGKGRQGSVMFIDSASHHVLDRLHDLLTTAAAAKIPGQIILNLSLRRLRSPPFTLSEIVFFIGLFKSKTRKTVRIPIPSNLHYSITPSLHCSITPSFHLITLPARMSTTEGEL